MNIKLKKNKKTYRNITSIVITTVILATVLSGCGASKSNVGNSNNTAANTKEDQNNTNNSSANKYNENESNTNTESNVDNNIKNTPNNKENSQQLNEEKDSTSDESKNPSQDNSNTGNNSMNDEKDEFTLYLGDATVGSSVNVDRKVLGVEDNIKYYQVAINNKDISKIYEIHKETVIYPPQEEGTTVELKLYDSNQKLIRIDKVTLKSK